MTASTLLNRKLRRDLRQRRGQVIAVAITVFLGVTVLVMAAAVSANLDNSKDLTYERTAFADVWVTGGSDDMAQTIGALDGVARVEQRTVAEVGVQFRDRPIRTRIVGFDTDTTLNSLVTTAGSDLDPSTTDVVLEQHTADNFNLGPGDTVSIAGVGIVNVAGVATSPEWLAFVPSNQDIIVDPDEFGVLFAPEAMAATAAPGNTQLVIAVANRDAVTIADVEVAAIDNGAVEVLTRESHPSDRSIQGDVEGFASLAFMFPLLFLAAAALATMVLLNRLIIQQRAVIGALRANGISTAAVKRHYAKYGVGVALVGAIPAIGVGVLTAWVATTVYTDFLGIPNTSRDIYPLTWILGLVFAVVVGAIAGGLPARTVTRMDPATAMRPGGGAISGRHSLLERALPSGSPSWIRMAMRNLSRRPGRAFATGSGVVLALIVTMTALMVNDTNNDMFNNQFTHEDQRGLVVTFDRPVNGALLEEVAAVEGVSTAEPHLEMGASFVAGGTNFTEELQVFAAGTKLHNFDPVSGLPIDGLVLSVGAADGLGVSAGDQVEVRAIDGTTGTVNVVSIITESYRGSSYLSANAWSAIGGPEPHTLALGLENRDDHRIVRDAVAQIEGVEQLSDQVAMADQLEGMLSASRTFVSIVLALAIAMAVALIFNALSVTIGERETEVATLQANGVGRQWIRRAIRAENLITVGLALGPGLILGWLIAKQFYSQFNTDQITFEPILNLTSWIGAALLILVCAFVAQFPGLRRLDHLDLATKVRERAL